LISEYFLSNSQTSFSLVYKSC